MLVRKFTCLILIQSLAAGCAMGTATSQIPGSKLLRQVEDNDPSPVTTTTLASPTTTLEPQTSTTTTLDPALPPTAAYSFSFPAEFVSKPSQGMATRKSVMNIPSSESFRQIVVKAEIFNGGFNNAVVAGVYRHYYPLFWFTRGGKWNSHVIGVPTARDKSKKLQLGVNVDKVPVDAYTPGNAKDYSSFFVANKWYTVEFVYDAPSLTLYLKLTDPSGKTWSMQSPSTSTTWMLYNPYNSYVLFFGQEYSTDSVDPASSTENWRIKNLKVDFFK